MTGQFVEKYNAWFETHVLSLVLKTRIPFDACKFTGKKLTFISRHHMD